MFLSRLTFNGKRNMVKALRTEVRQEVVVDNATTKKERKEVLWTQVRQEIVVKKAKLKGKIFSGLTI